MGTMTGIQWCDHTFNPWRGCTKVSPGCTHCYAETLSARNPAVLGEWGPDGKRVIAAESYWRLPLKWDRQTKRDNVRRRVFCMSLGDIFEDRPELVEPRNRLFRTINQTPNLNWLLLTKRPSEAIDYFDQVRAEGQTLHWGTYDQTVGWDGETPFPLPNVWLGVSVEDQQRADERIPLLLQIPATVRFLSIEPLLGPIELIRPGWLADCPEIGEYNLAHYGSSQPLSWIIVGGESGRHARPMHPDWARSICDQCQAAGVAFFFKQWGEWQPVEPEADEFPTCGSLPDANKSWPMHDWDDYRYSIKVGKDRAGDILDGRQWHEFPEVACRSSN